MSGEREAKGTEGTQVWQRYCVLGREAVWCVCVCDWMPVCEHPIRVMLVSVSVGLCLCVSKCVP